MKKVLLLNRIHGEINESEAKNMNQLSEEEVYDLADKITEGVVALLKSQGESAEGLFNPDEEEDCIVVNITDIDEQGN